MARQTGDCCCISAWAAGRRLGLVGLFILVFAWLSPSAFASHSFNKICTLVDAPLCEPMIPLFAKPLNALSEDERIAAALALADADYGPLAALVWPQSLPADPQAIKRPDALWVAFQAAASRGDRQQTQMIFAALLRTLTTRAPEGDQAAWLSRIKVGFAELHGNDLYADLLDEAQAMVQARSDWPELEPIWWLWTRERDGWAETDAAARRKATHCRSTARCLAWMDYLEKTDDDVAARRAYLQAWRFAATPEEWETLVAAALDGSMADLAGKPLENWLATRPAPDNLLRVLARWPEAKPQIAAWFAAQPQPENMTERFDYARLAAELEQFERVAYLLPEAEQTLGSTDELLAGLRAWVMLTKLKNANADAAAWKKRLDELLVRMEKMELSASVKAQAVFILGQQKSGRPHDALVSFSQALAASDSMFANMAAVFGYTWAAKRDEAKAALVAVIGQGEPRLQRLAGFFQVWLHAGFMDFDAAGYQDMEALRPVMRAGLDGEIASEADRLWAALLANLLEDRQRLAGLVKSATTAEIPVWTRLTLAAKAYDQRLRSEAQQLLLGLPDELDSAQRIEAMAQWFNLGAHEKAIAVKHQLEADSPNGDLFAARRLLKRYRRWLWDLTYLQRRTRVSLDIYTQSVLTRLREHLDAKGANAQWLELLTLLQSMERPFYWVDLEKVELREGAAAAGQDVDGMVFEVYQRFLQSGPHRIEAWQDLLIGLAANRNPDFFSAAVSQTDPKQFDNAALWRLTRNLLLRADAVHADAVMEYMDAYILRILKDPDALFAAASDAFAIAGWFEKQQETLPGKKVLAKLEAAIEHATRRGKSWRETPDGDGPLKVRLNVSLKSSGHQFNADAIFARVNDLEIVLADCVREVDAHGEAFDATAMIYTDANGWVQDVQLVKWPYEHREAGDCVDERLSALVLSDLQPPFGYAELSLRVEPAEIWGMSEFERDRFARAFAQDLDTLEQAREAIRTELAWRKARLDSTTPIPAELVADAVAQSYDPAIYREAAWWMETIQDDPKRAAMLRSQARWVWLGPYALIGFILLVIALIAWRVHTVHRKARLSQTPV